MTTDADAIELLIDGELSRPVPEPVRAIARAIVARHGDSVLGILFYGSCRRHFDPDGLVDLYVIYDRHRRFHRRRFHAALNALLPPNVTSWQVGRPVRRAKVASLSLRQFDRATRRGTIDTTIWARFAQPCSLIHARDAAAAAAIAHCLRGACLTALAWLERFSAQSATPSQRWRALFAQTYGAELRPERGGRPASVYEADAGWFSALLAGAPAVMPASGSWRLRRAGGRALNVLRLAKAAFTFEGGADYVAWKLRRHAAIRFEPTDWQRRHPLLAGPVVLARLLRAGVFRRDASGPPD